MRRMFKAACMRQIAILQPCVVVFSSSANISLSLRTVRGHVVCVTNCSEEATAAGVWRRKRGEGGGMSGARVISKQHCD
jgi:hypothetical protein